MQATRMISGRAIPWGAKNIDTDIIIPAKWLKTVSRDGLGKGAFESVRAVPGNIFDAAENQGAPILLAGDNFGCGSSREHAAWAMLDMGLQAVIAPSFSDIFSGNAFKNGVLAVTLDEAQIARLMAVAGDGATITIDLENQVVTSDRQDRFAFAIDPFRKMCLMQGLDEIALTLAEETAISAHEARQTHDAPWLVPSQI
ncbi:MAG: 3-isopropylmalate dehydratase small subunit [Sphingomonadaceae bacterium]|nr:3-isopropylmalate dehydratase small subunit [Sphingomonadaceae bacterium]